MWPGVTRTNLLPRTEETTRRPVQSPPPAAHSRTCRMTGVASQGGAGRPFLPETLPDQGSWAGGHGAVMLLPLLSPGSRPSCLRTRRAPSSRHRTQFHPGVQEAEAANPAPLLLWPQQSVSEPVLPVTRGWWGSTQHPGCRGRGGGQSEGGWQPQRSQGVAGSYSGIAGGPGPRGHQSGGGPSLPPLPAEPQGLPSALWALGGHRRSG